MNKERLGNFIGGERRSLGSGAGSDGGGADGLPAAGGERRGGDHAEPVGHLPGQRAEGAAAVLVLLAITAAVVAYNLIIVRVNDTSQTFLLTETIGGENYVYLQMEGNHLLKLRCGENVQIIPEDLPEDLKDQGGDSLTFRVSYRYNRLTLEGELLSCEWDGGISLGGPEAMIGNVIGLDVNPETGDQLFGYTGVTERCDYAEGDPFLRVPVFAYTFSLQTGEKLLTVEDVVTYAQTDWDNDGESELAVRTIWEEKPYTVYDYEDGTITEIWPDTVDEDLAARLMTAAEKQAELDRELRQGT